mgnify:CR=1 FL=1|tara:strand:+ start:7462 stop:8316 length:855 start_codon:yes stop_codon:yes gene_type:complete
MKYQLKRKIFGKQNPEKITEINIPYKITDLCYSEENGFIFISGPAIGTIKGDKVLYPIVGNANNHNYSVGVNTEFLYPSSICCDKKMLYVTQNNFQSLVKVNLNDNRSMELFAGNNKAINYGHMSKLRQNVSCKMVKINSQLIVSLAEINKCIRFRDNVIEKFLGTGHGGYSVASDVGLSLLNGPKGLFNKDDKLYIADSNNNCIRSLSLSGKLELVVGHPLNKEISPTEVIVNNNYVFFVSNGNIYVTGKNTNSYSVFYSGITSNMSLGPEKGIYFLEKENAI